MKRIIMTLAIAGTLLGFGVPGQTPGLPFGPAEAKADDGSEAYHVRGDHKNGRHAAHGHHGKRHKKHHGHHGKKHKKHYGHRGGHHKERYGHHGKRRGHHQGYQLGFNRLKQVYRHAKRHSGYGGCHPVSKDGYWRGHHAKIGGTLCYDHYGNGYVVEGSRYVIHYY